jgi:tetratricopeptide (TPR) repeat protein/glycosyltransferase involved in cell wall biosynthesis
MPPFAPFNVVRRRKLANSEARRQGDLCRDERRWGEAADGYRKHLDEHPGDFAIWVQAGNCLKEAGKHQEALGSYWRAVALDGNDADVFLQLGHLYKLMGRREESAEAYRASVLRQPVDNLATLELASLGIKYLPMASIEKGRLGGRIVRGLIGGGMKTVKRSALPPEASDARTKGDRFRDEHRWAEAADEYRRHLSEHPYDFAIWVQSGNCLKESLSYENALISYWRAISLDATNSDVFLQFGHLNKRLGRPGEATIAYRVSLALQPESNPAAGELATLEVVSEDTVVATTVQMPDAPTGLQTRDVATADQPNVRQRLIAIENQLDRLIEASNTNSPVEAAPVTVDVLQSATAASHSAVADSPPLPVDAAAAGPGAIFLVVGPTSGSAAKDMRRLGRGLMTVCQNIRLVRWNLTDKRLELLTREEAERFGSTKMNSDAHHYPPSGASTHVIERSSCCTDDWVLVPDPIQLPPGEAGLPEMDMIIEAGRLGLRAAFIFKSAEALRLSKHRGADAAALEQYMQALLLANVVVVSSNEVRRDLKSFLRQHQKAHFGPLIKLLPAPDEAELALDGQWRDYGRRLRGVLNQTAQASRIVPAIYYLIEPVASCHTAIGVIEKYLPLACADSGIRLIPAAWDAENKRLVKPDVSLLDAWFRPGGTPLAAAWVEPGHEGAPQWILGADLSDSASLIEVSIFAKTHGLRTAAVLGEEIGDGRPSMRPLYESLAAFDKVLVVSERRYRDFYLFLLAWRGKLRDAEDRFKFVAPPEDVPGVTRLTTPRPAVPGVIHVLLRSSVGRSKDFSTLVQTVVEAAQHAALRAVITVVESASAIAGVRTALDDDKFSVPIKWVRHSETAQLERAFEEADFAVVPECEGENAAFVTECLWRGIPVLVGGTPSSVAIRKGTVLCDPRNRDDLAEGLLRMMDLEWRQSLAYEVTRRTVRTWSDFVSDVARELATDRLIDGRHRLADEQSQDVYASLINLRKRPKLSLCISTYNRAGWVGVNLKNIFTQIPTPRLDLEILVVDNTSTDNTPDVVKPYLNRPDFRYVRNPRNVGMLGNLAVTAQRARGEYIWIIGDDDLTRPGTIEHVLGIIDQHPGIGLIYMNYGYTTEGNPANVVDLDAFLASYNTLEPASPDEFLPVKHMAAKTENFFTAIWSHVYRRDHALRSYCQDTSGRIFSTMRSCVPTAYYVLNFMADEMAFWIGEQALIVNSNVSWTEYAPLFELEQFPRTWDLAERMGTDSADVDRRRANRLWLTEIMWRQILEQEDRTGNSRYFSAARVLLRLKHLKEIDKHIPEFSAIYDRARKAGHPAATLPTDELFSAFESVSKSATISSAAPAAQ